MNSDLVKAILQIGIGLLGQLIPWLGTFLGGPLGWLAGIAISWAALVLYKMIERARRFADIENVAAEQLAQVTGKFNALHAVQADPESAKETHDKALSDYMAAVGNLSRIRLRQP